MYRHNIPQTQAGVLTVLLAKTTLGKHGASPLMVRQEVQRRMGARLPDSTWYATLDALTSKKLIVHARSTTVTAAAVDGMLAEMESIAAGQPAPVAVNTAPILELTRTGVIMATIVDFATIIGDSQIGAATRRLVRKKAQLAGQALVGSVG